MAYDPKDILPKFDIRRIEARRKAGMIPPYDTLIAAYLTSPYAHDKDDESILEDLSALIYDQEGNIRKKQPDYKHIQAVLLKGLAKDFAEVVRCADIGKVSGYYAVRELKRGSLVDVYQAHDYQNNELTLKHPNKKLRAHLDTPEGAELRRHLEDRIRRQMAASQSTPTIAHLHVAVSNATGEYYIIETYMPETLEDKLASMGGFNTPLNYIDQLTTALFTAHTTRLEYDDPHKHPPPFLHRNIKPSNIGIFGRTAKLFDFNMFPNEFEYTPRRDMRGRLLHLPPESFDGDTYDARSDIHSLATVFYTMLTGKHPLLVYDPDLDIRFSNTEEYAQASERVKSVLGRSDYHTTISRYLKDALAPARNLRQHLEQALHPEPQERHASATEFTVGIRSSLTDRKTLIDYLRNSTGVSH